MRRDSRDRAWLVLYGRTGGKDYRMSGPRLTVQQAVAIVRQRAARFEATSGRESVEDALLRKFIYGHGAEFRRRLAEAMPEELAHEWETMTDEASHSGPIPEAQVKGKPRTVAVTSDGRIGGLGPVGIRDNRGRSS